MEKRLKTIEVFVTSDGKEHFTEWQAELHEEKMAEVKELSVQQKRNEESQRENERRVQAVRDRWVLHPEEKEAFLERHRARHLAFMEAGVVAGWWSGFNPNTLDPLPKPTVIRTSDLEPHETLMAHIMVRLGIFKTVSDARRNGWDKPIEPCDIWLKKKTINLQIVT